jgi:hypothetical protein
MTMDAMSWSDSSDHKWSAAITLAAAKRLKETQSIDLLDPQTMATLFGPDPLVRVEAIAELAREQWQALSLDYAAFAERLLSPGSFPKATAALRAAISDFFRRLDRNDLAIVSDRAWAAMEADRKLREEEAGGNRVGNILEAAQRRSRNMMESELDKAFHKINGTESGS